MSDARQLLHERAVALARRDPADLAPQALLEVLEFQLAGETYGVETRHVREVQALRGFTPLPCTPAFIEGVVNVRGRVVAVIDLKKFFGLPTQGLTDLHRVILVGNDELEFGLLADMSLGVCRIAADSLHSPPSTLSGINASYLKGVTSARMSVLDLDAIFADPRIVVHDEADE